MNTLYQTPEWAHEEIDPNWYAARMCSGSGSSEDNEWDPAPGYFTSATYKQYRWPALDWTELTCSNGDAPSATSNKNPAGVPSLCGEDFEIWFNALVPPVPPTSTPRGSIAGTAGPSGNGCFSKENLVVLANGSYTLIWQGDGNLVLYNGALTTSNAVWSAGTSDSGTLLCWQDDGNLVVYGSGTVSAPSDALWHSNTADSEQGGDGGQKLELLQDGALDIVNADGTVLWTSS